MTKEAQIYPERPKETYIYDTTHAQNLQGALRVEGAELPKKDGKRKVKKDLYLRKETYKYDISRAPIPRGHALRVRGVSLQNKTRIVIRGV